METSDAAAVEAAAKAAMANRVRAVLRLISPEHITPLGVRQIELALQDELNRTSTNPSGNAPTGA